MINKKSLWFLTLFSLILVLSVYYITMPSELLIGNNSNYVNNIVDTDPKQPVVTTTESEILVALRVEAETQMMKQIDEYESVLTIKDSTFDQKNNAF